MLEPGLTRPVLEPGLAQDARKARCLSGIDLASWFFAPCPVSRPRTGTTTREPGLPRGNRDYHGNFKLD